jgi:hypothetical protein
VSGELGTTEDPRALVPGDPAGVAADARELAERAAAVLRTGEALRRIGTGAWTGPASDAWRDHHDEDAVRWFQGADSLDAASRALAGHAGALRRAQFEAARAIAAWRAGEAATADVERQVAAGATAPPVDPGEAARRDAVEILAAARAELQRSGDEVASVLRGEAALAPHDSQKQADADFYGGILASVSAAAQGAWTLVSDPAVAAAGAVQAAARPVDTAKGAIAYDDWAGGCEPRALGRNTGDLILGAATLGAGRIASILGRETRVAGEPGAASLQAQVPGLSRSPGDRTEQVRQMVLDSSGRPPGIEALGELRSRFGAPHLAAETPKGRVETWMVDPDAGTKVTYRPFSSSGGATIDIHFGRDFPVKRLHIREGP